jgi:hypothetical protein
MDGRMTIVDFGFLSGERASRGFRCCTALPLFTFYFLLFPFHFLCVFGLVGSGRLPTLAMF